jgi:phytoene dehydrogenase-like protein
MKAGMSSLSAAALAVWPRQPIRRAQASARFSWKHEITSSEGVSAPLAAEAFYCLDQKLINDLHLEKFGLRILRHAMPVTALRPDGRHLTLPHELSLAREAITAEGSEDAAAYRDFRRAHYSLARQLRSLWVPRGDSMQWRHPAGSLTGISRGLRLSASQQELLEIAARSSANVYLRNWFESDTLVMALSFDTALDGVSPDEPSSALLLVWRAAQEFAGAPGAIGQVEGGPEALASALTSAAREAGAVLRADADVSAIELKNERVCGVRLGDDSTIESKIVISSLGAQQTFDELLLPECLPFGSLRHAERLPSDDNAKAFFTLKGLPPFAGLSERELRGRLITSETSDAAARSKFAARMGLLPRDLIMEITVPSIADPSLSVKGVHVLSANIPFLPISPRGGWEANMSILETQILSELEIYAPGLKDRVIEAKIITPDDIRARHGRDWSSPNFYERLLRSYGDSVRTPIKGLYLCGLDAEPTNAVTGRAGRVAALLALAEN